MAGKKKYTSTVNTPFNYKGKSYQRGDKFITTHEFTHKQLLTDKKTSK